MNNILGYDLPVCKYECDDGYYPKLGVCVVPLDDGSTFYEYGDGTTELATPNDYSIFDMAPTINPPLTWHKSPLLSYVAPLEDMPVFYNGDKALKIVIDRLQKDTKTEHDPTCGNRIIW